MFRIRYIVDVLHEDPIPEAFKLTDIVREGHGGSYVLGVNQGEAETLRASR